VAQASIIETWDPIGLGGTGSHDVRFDDVFVPSQRTFAWPAAAPAPDVDYPARIFVPGTWFIANCAAATYLGLARRALDEARSEMRGKVDRYSQRPLLQHPSTQRSLEAAEGLWYACRAGLREALRSVWESALSGEPLSAEQRVNVRVAAVTAVAVPRGVPQLSLRATSTLAWLYRMSSGSARTALPRPKGAGESVGPAARISTWRLGPGPTTKPVKSWLASVPTWARV
jgi:alkylation response protein AidB-like acyl-CoA dehydrogenase